MANLKQFLTRKTAVIGVIAVALAGLGIYQYQSSTKVAYYEVTTQSVERLINVKAQTLPRESLWYASNQSGVLLTLPFDKDTAVAKDDVILTLQPFDFESKQIELKTYAETLKANADAGLSGKDRSSFNNAYDKYIEQDQAMTQALLAHTSVLQLFRTQMISSDSYKESLLQINEQLKKYVLLTGELALILDISKTEDRNFAQTSTRFKSAWEPVKGIEKLLSAKTTDDKTTEVQPALQVKEYKALKDGVVSRRTADQAMYLPIGTPIIEISNPELVKLQMDVSVEQLVQLKLGTKVRVKDDSDQIVSGKITEIDKVITDQMQSDGSILKLVKVSANLDKTNSMKFYSTITASIIEQYAENAVVVPKDLVFEGNGKYMVWVNQEGVLTEKEVEVQFETDDYYVIKSGLKKFDKLVMDTKLHLGQKIKF